MTPGDGWICGHLWMRRCDPPTGCPIHSCERHDQHKVAHRCSCGATEPLDPATPDEVALIETLHDEDRQ